MFRNVVIGCCVLFITGIALAEETVRIKETTALNQTQDPLKIQPLPCQPLKHTHVKVIEKAPFKGAQIPEIPDFFSKVRVLEGDCKDSEGWVTTTKLETEKK